MSLITAFFVKFWEKNHPDFKAMVWHATLSAQGTEVLEVIRRKLFSGLSLGRDYFKTESALVVFCPDFYMSLEQLNQFFPESLNIGF